YPSQARAVQRLRDFANFVARPTRPFLRRKQAGTRAIYLDGGYGIGKTHLLAATYHALERTGSRLYLSFAELAYMLSRLSPQAMQQVLNKARLFCIDEFELDDIAQTRMAAITLQHVLTHSMTNVVTTSNTLPTDLGR